MPNSVTSHTRSDFSLANFQRRLAAGAILALALFAYSGSFSGPFIFDDLAAIQEGNPAIRHLWPLGPILSPPPQHGQTVGGRPLLNLSLAINYAISGTGVWSYHALNLVIHLMASLLLFGILRRTCQLMGGNEQVSTLGGASIAALWAAHPLQTESVAYVIQRAESLMGFFYLLTLYGFILGANEVEKSGTRRQSRWLAVSWVACLCGMATKEVMVTAPVVVLLFDRTFVAGSFVAAFRRRSAYYAALAATWIPLAYWVMGTGGRGGTAGWGGALSSLQYLELQIPAVAHYLRLAVWPSILVFDYGPNVTFSKNAFLFGAVLLAILAAASAWAFARRRPEGFLGVAFFILLAPSSSIVPIEVQPVAEHRMYLPLALMIATVGLVAWRIGSRAPRLRTLWIVAVVTSCLLAYVTANRVKTYGSALTLWGDTAAKAPQNARALCNYADALMANGRSQEALSCYGEALKLELPRATGRTHTVVVEILINYANALLGFGRTDEAKACYLKALEFDPGATKALFNLGSLLMAQGDFGGASVQLQKAVESDPLFAPARNNLASVLLGLGNYEDAIDQYRVCLAMRPDSPVAFFNLGNALLRAGRPSEAADDFSSALRLKPDFSEAMEGLQKAGAPALLSR